MSTDRTATGKIVYSDARYCAGRNHRENPRHGRLPRIRAGADAEIRSTGRKIARYSQMADPSSRPRRLSRQEADLNAANAGATHASHGGPWKATQGLRGAGPA